MCSQLVLRKEVERIFDKREIMSNSKSGEFERRTDVKVIRENN